MLDSSGPFEGIGISLGFMAVIGFAMAVTAMIPLSRDRADESAQQYAVVYSPGTSHIESMKKLIRAGGEPVRPGVFDFIIIGSANNEDFTKAAYRNGAWLVFDPAIRGSCLSVSKNSFVKTQGT